MKNTKKRLATATLAGAMALSLAVPAFAAAQSTKVTATYQEIAINVTVPTTADITINPLGMPVAIKPAVIDEDGTVTAAATELSDQLVSVPKTIVNNCTMDIIVNANVTGTVKGNLKFVATPWDKTLDPNDDKYKYADDDDATAKAKKDADKKVAAAAQAAEKANSAFVFLEMVKVADNSTIMGDTDDSETDVDETKTIDEAKLATAFALESNWNIADVADLQDADALTAATTGTPIMDKVDTTKVVGYEDDAIIVLAAKAVENNKGGLVRLAAADRTTGEVQNGGIAMMRLGGQVSVKPTKGWAKTDGFGATIAYTFTAEKPATT